MSEQAEVVQATPEVDESRIPTDLVGFTKWRNSGELPPSSEPQKTQETAPADAPKEAEKQADAKSETASDDKQEQDTEHRVPKWRFDQELAKKRAEKEAREKLQAEFEAYKKANPPQGVKPSAEAPKAEPSELEPPKFPDQTDFDNWEAFQAYKKEYPKLLSQFTRKVAETERRNAIAEVQRQQALERQDRELSAKVEAGLSKHKDYKERAGETYIAIMDKGFPEEVRAYVGESPDMIELLYAMGDKETLEDLVSTALQNPRAAIRKIAKVEALLGQEVKPKAEPAPEPKQPKVTSAPKAPEPVSGGAAKTFDVSDETGSAEEWARRRNEQLRRR